MMATAAARGDVTQIPTGVGGAPDEAPTAAATAAGEAALESAKCECCGLTEECTEGYIAVVRARHGGRWICGLCAEGVKDEIHRSGTPLTTEEALHLHAMFRSSPPPADAAGSLIFAVSRLIRRSFDSPRGARSLPASPGSSPDREPRLPLSRTGSCFSTLAR